MEHADLVVVTKADGELLPEARRVQSDYLSALKLVKRARGDRHWKPTVSGRSVVLSSSFIFTSSNKDQCYFTLHVPFVTILLNEENAHNCGCINMSLTALHE